MAANEYLKAAAGQLESAANALKLEIDQIRGEYITYERQALHDINAKDQDIHAINARLAGNPPAETQTMLRGRIKMLQGEIDKKKKELADRKNSMNQAVKCKEGAINGLMSQSRGLSNQAASLR